MLLAETIRSEQEQTQEITPQIESYVSSIISSSTVIFESDFFQGIQTSPEFASQLLSTPTSIDSFNALIHNLMEEDSVDAVKIYTALPPNKEPRMLPSSFASEVEILGSHWNGIFKGTPTLDTLLCPAFYLSPHEIKNYGDLAYIIRTTIYIENVPETAYLAVYFSADSLTEILSSNLSSHSNVSYIVNSRDSIVTTTDKALSGTYYFKYETIVDSLTSFHSFITQSILGEDVYAGFSHIESTDWFIVVVIPSSGVIAQGVTYIGLLFISYILCVLFSLIVASRISQAITSRIENVIHHMSTAKLGPPTPLPPSKESDEIGELIDTYNYMTSMIEKLLLEQEKTSESLRIAEFSALQAQINPHFLYNTMDMINWLAQKGETDNVTATVHNLSRFYKLSLSRKSTFNTLEMELEHTSIYVELQNMRFDNLIEFIVDIPDELTPCSIPKLTLQPIVENAILHGILGTDSKSGTIVICGWIEDDDLVLLVTDDGVGMSDDQLNSVLLGEKPLASKGTNIAIYNTHQRLQVLYGQRYGLRYTSVFGEGTEVEIRLPHSHKPNEKS